MVQYSTRFVPLMFWFWPFKFHRLNAWSSLIKQKKYLYKTVQLISGALGPVDGVNPELSNLTCSMTLVEAGDIVFITSDGVSDNFDPVVGKFCVPKKPERTGSGNNGSSSKAGTPTSGVLPSVAAYQRHELTLLRMEDLLNHGSGAENASPHSQSKNYLTRF